MQIQLLLILSLFIILSFEYKEENGDQLVVKVAAIFFKDENDTELSFVETFNKINNLNYFEIKFELIKRYIADDDSLILQQLVCEFINDGVEAIFGPSSKASSDIIALIANASGIPHIQFDLRIEDKLQDPLNHQMSINVAPSVQLLSNAILDIVRDDFRWEKFTIIYQTDLGLAYLQDVMKIHTVGAESVQLRRLSDYENDYRVLLKEALETIHETHFILECDPVLLVDLMKMAKKFNLLGDFKNWFFIHLDTHNSNLQSIYDSFFKANITAIRLKNVDTNPYERKKMRITPYDEILNSQAFLPTIMHDAVILYANAARNVIKNSNIYRKPQYSCEMEYNEEENFWSIGKRIIDEMKTLFEDNLDPPLKTENIEFDEFGNRNKFSLEIYRPIFNQPLAIWKPNEKIAPITSINPMGTTPSALIDFTQRKKVFTVATHVEAPYFRFKDNHMEERGNQKYEGYAVDLIRFLSDKMNFDYEFKIYGGNGKYDEDKKKWDGIIGGLIDHEAQIGIADITITQKRREVVDFTVPFMQLGIAILYYKGPAEAKDNFAFLKPFSGSLWYSMMLAQLIVTLLFVFIARISYYEYRNPRLTLPDSRKVKNKWNTHNSFWLMVGSIMQQGCDILPRAPPMRILTGIWWFFAMMVVSTYTASLAAFLTTNKMQSEIKNLEGLIDQNVIQFGTLEGGSTYQFFKESNHSIYLRAWNKMKTFKPSTFMKLNSDGVLNVKTKKGKFAYLMETTSILYNTERNSDLQKIGSQIGEKHYAIAVPKGAEYRTNLSVSLLELGEKGTLFNLKNKWWKKGNNTSKKKNEEEEEDDGMELSIIQLSGVFLCLAGGILLATIIGLLEFFWNLQTIAVNERVTPWIAFKAECDFAWRIWLKRKPKYITEHYGRRSHSASHHSSRAHSRGHSRGHSRAREPSSRASSKTKSS